MPFNLLSGFKLPQACRLWQPNQGVRPIRRVLQRLSMDVEKTLRFSQIENLHCH